MNLHRILLGSFIIMSNLCSATSFFIRPFDEFTQSAPHIVRGTVERIRVEHGVTEDGGKTIYTFANLNVREVIKGAITTDRLTLRKLGGSKDGVTLDIPSSVEFVEGEESVFFLGAENPDRSFPVTGMQLGKFGLREENGTQILTGGLFDFSEHQEHAEHTESHQTTERASEVNRKRWTLNDLRTLVKNQPSYVPNPTPDTSTLAQSNTPPTNFNESTTKSPTSLSQSDIRNDAPPPNAIDSSSEKNSGLALFAWAVGAILLAASLFMIIRKKS
jgi:hypothetical protein